MGVFRIFIFYLFHLTKKKIIHPFGNENIIIWVLKVKNTSTKIFRFENWKILSINNFVELK